jgi:diaminopimelate decarboxylase
VERFSEYIGYDDQGRLTVEEVDVAWLAPERGTPLYITSSAQIRHNYRRFHAAFAAHYPDVHVHYAIKDLPGHAPWVHVDTSSNHLLRLQTAGYYYRCIPVIDTGGPRQEVEIVGPTCTPDVLEKRVMMPRLARGDLVAFLDAGMYAETNGNQYNGLPRPATVLISGTRVDLIKERETYLDVFAKQRVPEWLTRAQPALAQPALAGIER